MEEISLHILDLVQNSIVAKATIVEIIIAVDTEKDELTITIKDNGNGMTEETLRQVVDPFYTTRKTRKVGMGISLFKALAEMCEGQFNIYSIYQKGTTITTTMQLSHIDRPPMGCLEDTMTTLILCNPDVEFLLSCKVNERSYSIDTREIKQVLDGVPINEPEVISWLKTNLLEGLQNTYGGVQI